MSKIFPHARFQSSLKAFNNTGFGFRIFSSEEMNLLNFQEILKFFILNSVPLSVCKLFGHRPLFNTDLKAMTKVFPVLSLIGTTHAYLEKTSMMQSKYLQLYTCHWTLIILISLPNLLATEYQFQPLPFCVAKTFYE